MGILKNTIRVLIRKGHPMIATIINCILILLGSMLGLLLKGKLPQRFLTVLTQALGLCVVSIGMTSAIGTKNTLCVVVCLVVGTILGEAIDIEKRLDSVGESLRKRFEKNSDGNSTFTEDITVCKYSRSIHAGSNITVSHYIAVAYGFALRVFLRATAEDAQNAE